MYYIVWEIKMCEVHMYYPAYQIIGEYDILSKNIFLNEKWTGFGLLRIPNVVVWQKKIQLN